MLPTRAKSLLSFLNDFNRCFLFKLFVGSPSKLPLFSRPPMLFLLRASSLFHQLFQPMNSLLFDILHLFSGGPNSSIRCWSYSFPWIKCFPCSFTSRQFILPECSGHLRRFVCVLINSRLPPHSNISIVPVHHLSVQHPFPMVFFLFNGPRENCVERC